MICSFSPPSFWESQLSLLLFKLTETSIPSASLLFLSLLFPWLFFVFVDDVDCCCFTSCCFVVADDAGCFSFAVLVVVAIVVTAVVAVIAFAVLVGFFSFFPFVPGSTPLLYQGDPQFLNRDLRLLLLLLFPWLP